MTTAQVELTQHMEHAKQMDASLFLGRLCWYTVSDMRIEHKQVALGLHHAGMDALLPPYPKDFDVFRRVSTKAVLKKIPVPDSTNYENYLIREIAGRGEDVVHRVIVVEELDRKGKRLHYYPVMNVLFSKSTGLITVSQSEQAPVNLDPRVEQNATAIVQRIRDEFVAWRGMLDNYAIREFIRKLIVSWGAVCIRDGLYFVAESQADDVATLENFVESLPGGATFHSMPLVDDSKQREMLKRAFQAETIDSIDALMGEIRDIRANDKKITTSKYGEIVARYRSLTMKTTEYEQLLDNELEETHSRLSIFSKMVIQLQDNVK